MNSNTNLEHGTGNLERCGPCIGWDIGGVNTKVARVAGGQVLAVRTRPFELQRAPHTLAAVLRALAHEVGAEAGDTHALTMTAELSQMFRTKREGVAFVLDAMAEAFPGARLRVFTVRGDFIDPDDARREALDVAAANWAATARLVAAHHSDALLVDVGTTTTDIIPIAGGAVAAAGRSDPERLASGELVYTGALRTPVEAIVTQAPYRGVAAGVSAEGFALAGDAHLWRGDLASADYTVPTPDGRPASREFAGERLARVICADRDLIDEAGVDAIAHAIAAAQVARIAGAIAQVLRRHPTLRTAVVTGLGAFLGRAAASAEGLEVVPLAERLGAEAAHCAPAACVALLLETAAPREGVPHRSLVGQACADGHELTVVKVGGSLLAHPEHLAAALAAIDGMARERKIVVVPGGGSFADVVRDVDLRVGLSDDAAHWMAILAMDQYAFAIAERLACGVMVSSAAEIRDALIASRVPVLAPSRWLRAADPLPHSWDVTSDSVAAWVAGEVGAERLLLIKPPGVGPAGVDAYFPRVLPAAVSVRVVSVDSLAAHLSRR